MYDVSLDNIVSELRLACEQDGYLTFEYFVSRTFIWELYNLGRKCVSFSEDTSCYVLSFIFKIWKW